MGAILPPNPSLREGVGGGKYFSKQYLNGRLHAKFQLSSTKIEGVSLNGGGGDSYPQNPLTGWGLGEEVKYIFLKCPKQPYNHFIS